MCLCPNIYPVDPSTLAIKFISEVKPLLALVLNQIDTDGYSSAVKRQFADLVFQIPPIAPLREGRVPFVEELKLLLIFLLLLLLLLLFLFLFLFLLEVVDCGIVFLFNSVI
jgi:hypothetical protein